MAVNLANALAEEFGESYLIVTRLEGDLSADLNEAVQYQFLAKKHRFDVGAFMKLRKFVSDYKIELVHAHGSSWFFGVLLKLSGCDIKLIWHDHYGESEYLAKRKTFPLSKFTSKIDGVIAVNDKLADWHKKELKLKNSIQLNNFIEVSTQENTDFKLKGEETDFKIICVANFRPQKDHFNLLESLEFLPKQNISVHLFGKGFNDEYETSVGEKAAQSKIPVYVYKNQVVSGAILRQADLGVLGSRSEGLPLRILEYSLAGLPVVCTNVGQCRQVTGGYAKIISPGDSKKLAEAIIYYLEHEEAREKDTRNLQERVRENYTVAAVLPKLLSFYNSIL